MRALLIVVAFACNTHDKDKPAGVSVYNDDGHPVTLRLKPDVVELEQNKSGKKQTFKIGPGDTSPATLKPIVDAVWAADGKKGITVWGRYDAPDLWNSLFPSFEGVPTTICLRDGNNC